MRRAITVIGVVSVGLFFSAATNAAAVSCNNNGGDAALLQNALNAGGAFTVSGTCQINTVLQTAHAGTSMTGASGARLNSSTGEYLLHINHNDVTVAGLILNGGGILTTPTSLSTPISGVTITGNTFQNITNGTNGVEGNNVWTHFVISNNHFLNIGTVPMASWNNSLIVENDGSSACAAFGGCKGGGVHNEDGIDNTKIENNVFDTMEADELRIVYQWILSSDPSAFVGGANNSLSYNTFIRNHRMGIETQGVAQDCPSSVTPHCAFGKLANITNLKLAGNYAYNFPAPYWDSYAYSWPIGVFNPTIINNTGVMNSQAGHAGYAYEDSDQGSVTEQGNVASADSGSDWGAYFMLGPIPSSTHLYQNNIVAGGIVGDDSFYARENAGGTNAGTVQKQFNIQAAACAVPSACETSTLAVGGGPITQSNGTATLSLFATDEISVKWAQFFLDNSATPAVTQEIQDVNSNFSSDGKWLYHAGFQTAALAQGTHSIKAVVTDVSGATKTLTQTFTLGTGGTVQSPSITSFSSSASSIVTGQSVTLSWSQTGATQVSIDNGVGDVSGKTSVSISPTQTTTYTLTATNSAGSVTAAVKVTVTAAVAAPVISSFTAAPASIANGQSSTLSWTQTGATSLTLDNGIGDVTGKASTLVSPTQTTTYLLTATNATGSVTSTTMVVVTVPTGPAPAAASGLTGFSPNGSSIQLSWTDNSANETGFLIQRRATSGIDGFVTVATVATNVVTFTDTELNDFWDYDYQVVATNAGANAAPSNKITVQVGVTSATPPASPVISMFTAAPASITAGGSATLSWTASGATTLSISNGVGTVTGTSVSVSPAQTTTYILSATNHAGTTTSSATVTVTVPTPKPTITTFSAAPSTVTAGQASVLSWTVIGATSLSIDHGVGDVSGQTSISVSPTSTTIYTLSALNSAGTVMSTTTITVNAPTPKPTISVFAASPSSISSGASSTLSWTVVGATELSIDQGIGDVSGKTSVPVSPMQTTVFTLSATNSAGTVLSTTTVIVSVASGTALSAPLHLTVTSPDESSALLMWQDTQAGVTNFIVQRRATQSSDSFATVATVPANAQQFLDVGLNDGWEYDYQVLATNGVSTSAPSNKVTIQIGVTGTPPVSHLPVIVAFVGTPSSITAGGSSTLTWAYQVSGSSAATLSIDHGVGIVTSLDGKVVTPNTTTTYTLSITNAAGTVTSTTTITVEAIIGTAPAAPSGLSATAADGSVTLAWTASTGATGYHVKRSQTSDSAYATIANAPTASFSDASVMDGTTYYYVVTAINANGESQKSNEVAAMPERLGVTVDPTLPVPTLKVPSILTGDEVVSATYPSGFDVTAYRWIITPLDRSSASTPTSLVGTSTLSLAPLSLAPGAYEVQAAVLVDAGRLSRFSSATTQLRSASVLIQGNATSVYPNPWRMDKHAGHPILFTGLADGSDVKIFSAAAHYITTLTVSGSQATWDPSDAASGLYLYTVKNSSGGTSKGKFVIIK